MGSTMFLYIIPFIVYLHLHSNSSSSIRALFLQAGRNTRPLKVIQKTRKMCVCNVCIYTCVVHKVTQAEFGGLFLLFDKYGGIVIE